MTADPHSLVFGIERVDASTLRAQKKHDNREGSELPNVDAKRTHKNRVLVGTGDPLADANAVIAKHSAKLRKDNRAPYDRIVLSASRDMFRDKEAAQKWLRDSMNWLRSEYGPGLAYAVLHLDERTPHIHAVAAPIIDRGEKGWIVSHSKHPSHRGKNSYAKMRERAAAATGLAYGERGGKPKAQAQREAEEALARAKREAERIRSRSVADAKHITEQAFRDAALIIESARHVKRDADREKERNLTIGAALAKRADEMKQFETAEQIRNTLTRAYPKPKQMQNKRCRDRDIER